MTYQAPVDDIVFALETAAGLHGLIADGTLSVDADTVRSIIEEAGRFATEVLDPLNAIGDRAGSKLVDGKVVTPPGWKEAAARQMRVATFTPPGEGAQPELYVSTPFGGTLLMNVNRWRVDDAGLPAVAEAELPGVTTEIKLGEAKAYKVDFKGPGGNKKGGPFAGGM